jgi:hypothetical protein
LQAALLGDANLDGVVDGFDLLVWNTHKSSPAATLGNPATSMVTAWLTAATSSFGT